MQNFIQFVRQQGVVGLAIGFILGGAVGKVVASLVNDIIMPALALILGSTEGLKGLAYLGINYGAFIATLVDFLIIAGVIYVVFKQLGLEKLDAPK
ncbi:MscL family protein [Patescibacteria group bacterium]|nr:MscL family protein [Patescibacteria group bacterium]